LTTEALASLQQISFSFSVQRERKLNANNYKFARVEQYCGRKGGLANRLKTVETKA